MEFCQSKKVGTLRLVLALWKNLTGNRFSAGFIYTKAKAIFPMIFVAAVVTRMHSSRMRTAHSSSRRGGGSFPGTTPPRGQTHTCKHITLPQTDWKQCNRFEATSLSL